MGLALVLALCVSVPALAPAVAAESPSPTPSTTDTVDRGAGAAIPIWAYFYIWYDPSTWDRAKKDLPLAGAYSSDERAVMRTQVELAQSAGIDGFLVSWKNTPKLTDRLGRIAEISREADFNLGIVYQGLDFARRPIEIRQVCADLAWLADTYGDDPVFHLRGDKPVVVWTGTDQFSSEDQAACVDPVRDRLTVLASSRSVEEWERAAPVFEGSAYYWSSVNPLKEWYPRKLLEMGDAVHATGGLWVAPAAPGFDARLVGGKTVVPRRGNSTLLRELDVALGTAPDAIGLISWNEYSENSQVEPSQKYGTNALEALSTFTGSNLEIPSLDSSAPRDPEPTASGFNGVAAMLIMGAILGAILVWSRWRRDPADADGHGPRTPGHGEHSARHGHGNGNGNGSRPRHAPPPRPEPPGRDVGPER